MKKAIRIFAMSLASFLLASLFVGCGNTFTDPTEPSEPTTEHATDAPKEYVNAGKFQEFMLVYASGMTRTGHKFLLDSIREYSGSDKEPQYTTNIRKEAQRMIVYGSKGGIAYGEAQALAADLLPGQFKIAYRKTSEPDEESENGVYVEERLYILGGSDAMSIKGVEYFLTHYIINDEAFPEEDFTYVSVNRPELADPCILLDGDTYYMYGSYVKNDGFYYYTSEDLITWTDVECSITAESFGAEYCMNPEIYKINGKYYIVGTYGKDGVRHIGSFEGDSPAGPFTLVSADLANSAWNCIDPTLYFSADGKVWMAYVAEKGFADPDLACMMLVEVKNDLTETVGEPKLIFKSSDGVLYEEDYWLEGPCFAETEKGTILLMYTGYTNHRNRYKYFSSARLLGAEMATDIWHTDNFTMYMRDWELETGNITTLFSGGHPFVFKDKEGKTKIAYHIEAEDSDYGYIDIFDLEYDDVDDVFTIAHDPLIKRFKDPEAEE